MSDKPRQFKVTKITPAYWRIIFDNPPAQPDEPGDILDLQEVVSGIESDPRAERRGIRQRPSDFFIARYDLAGGLGKGRGARSKPLILGALQIPVEGKQSPKHMETL